MGIVLCLRVNAILLALLPQFSGTLEVQSCHLAPTKRLLFRYSAARDLALVEEVENWKCERGAPPERDADAPASYLSDCCRGALAEEKVRICPPPLARQALCAGLPLCHKAA